MLLSYTNKQDLSNLITQSTSGELQTSFISNSFNKKWESYFITNDQLVDSLPTTTKTE